MKVFAALALGFVVAGSGSAFAGTSYGYSKPAAPEMLILAADHAPLTDSKGMTLYTFDKDADGVSNCNGECAEKWPPYFAEAGAAAPGDGFTMITRADGTQQWAKNGQALYFWIGDAEPGDTTGDGVGGVWHTAH